MFLLIVIHVRIQRGDRGPDPSSHFLTAPLEMVAKYIRLMCKMSGCEAEQTINRIIKELSGNERSEPLNFFLIAICEL